MSDGWVFWKDCIRVADPRLEVCNDLHPYAWARTIASHVPELESDHRVGELRRRVRPAPVCVGGTPKPRSAEAQLATGVPDDTTCEKHRQRRCAGVLETLPKSDCPDSCHISSVVARAPDEVVAATSKAAFVSFSNISSASGLGKAARRPDVMRARCAFDPLTRRQLRRSLSRAEAASAKPRDAPPRVAARAATMSHLRRNAQ